jgi:hypothetical protein
VKLSLKLALGTLCFATTPVSAATVMITSTGFDTPGYRSGSLTYTPTSYVLGNVGAGRIKMGGKTVPGGNPVSYLTYCVDIFHTLHSGQFTMPTLASYVGSPLKLSQLTAYVTNADLLIAAASTASAKRDASAAVQLGVWEILYEGSGSFNLNAGQFKFAGGDSATARTLATNWLGKVSSGQWKALSGKRLNLLYSANNQSQIYIGAIPEPASWAMMLIGFGAVGGAMRRSQRSGVRQLACL